MSGKTPARAAFDAWYATAPGVSAADFSFEDDREAWEAAVAAAVMHAAPGPAADRIAELEKTLASVVAENDELLRERNQALIAQVNGTCCDRGRELAAERGHVADLERQLAETLASYRGENERLRGLLNEASIADPECTVCDATGGPHGVPDRPVTIEVHRWYAIVREHGEWYAGLAATQDGIRVHRDQADFERDRDGGFEI